MRRIFISYSHDSDEHKNRVHQLADRLKNAGLAVTIDRDKLPAGPDEGWPKWSEAQVTDSDLVLIVCTRTYRRRYEGEEDPGVGLGATWEARAVYQLLYNTKAINKKFRVVLFSPGDNDHVPLSLQPYHRFQLDQPAEYSQLLEWLRGPETNSQDDQPSPGVVQWPSAAPDYTWPLADRQEEFACFKAMVAGAPAKRILLVEGGSNTGKTMLLTELFAYAQNRGLRVAPVDLKGSPPLEDVFQLMLAYLGTEVLRESQAGGAGSRLSRVVTDLRKLSQPVVLIFDTFEQAGGDARDWVDRLLGQLGAVRAATVVIGGQQVPQAGIWRGLAESRKLRPITEVNHWSDYCHRVLQRHIAIEQIKTLATATGGAPGLMSALLRNLAEASPESSRAGGSS